MAHTIGAIRSNIAGSLGRNVELTCRNRRRESVQQGVLDGAYDSLFTVTTVVDGMTQRVSYTYCDVLTKAVTVKPL